MKIVQLQDGTEAFKGHPASLPVNEIADFGSVSRRRNATEVELRQAVADKDVQLERKDDLLRHQENLSRESDHRLMNSLQMIVSLLSLQSRTTASREAAEQLVIAANRVTMIVRIHRRLHSFDGAAFIAFRAYAEDLCRDFATMLTPQGGPEQIVVEGAEHTLSAEIGVPLGFIVAELVTNAAKHGKGIITIRLEADERKGYALSVSNDGSVLPDDFDPAASKGLGMKVITSFVGKIGGELLFDRGGNGEGTRFTVLFA